MRRVRLAAALLALLTMLVTVLFWFLPDVSLETIAGSAVATACLAIVAPFEARDPPARKRVVAACVAFVLAIGVALGFAFLAPADRITSMSALAALAAAGMCLVVWSFATRNRFSRPQWRDYYDR